MQQQYAELTAYRNQLNSELGQQNNWLAQLKAHPPDPKMKQKLDGEVQERSDEYDQAVRSSRPSQSVLCCGPIVMAA